MRGPAILQDEQSINDSLLRAIIDTRGQIDRLIDEQKAAVGGFFGGFDEEVAVIDRLGAQGADHPVILQPPVAAEAPAKLRRPAAPAVFDRLDEPSPTPPRPVSTALPEPAPASRPEDPRERLDALAKHLDRKLRQASGPGADAAARLAE